MGIAPEDFVATFNANHLHVASGDHVAALKTYCELMNIPADIVE
jgi:hypothetical protein